MDKGFGLTSKLFGICMILALVSTAATSYVAIFYMNAMRTNAIDGITLLGNNAKDNSTSALKELGEKMISQIGQDAAVEVEIYLDTHQNMTISQLQNDTYFEKIAVHKVGQTGYTSIMDLDTGYFYFHPQKALVNTDTHVFEKTLPKVWSILNKTISDHVNASGYYDWKEADSSIRDKFMSLTIIQKKTADGKHLFIAATTYIDEFLTPIKNAETRFNATTLVVENQLDTSLNNLRITFLSVFIVLIVVLIIMIFLISRVITKPIISLTKVTKAIEKGNLHKKIDINSKDEIGDLANSIDNMRNEIKKRTNELVQSEKMASIGLLVAGVSHEVNNPLAYIKSNSEFIKEDLEELKVLCKEKGMDVSIFDRLEKMSNTNLDGINRIAVITKTLKRFAKPDTGEMSLSDINQGIKDTLVIVHNRLKHRIEVIENYGEIPLLMCNIGQLNQVFMNMIINSSDSMDMGTIWIRTWYKKGNIYVEIQDNGKGIPSENLTRIFDPFFTTKKEGTGLGLSLGYKIVKEHKGDIKVESKVGKGTKVIVIIPAPVQNKGDE